ncbi:MAG: DUF1206 domain-containing protein [Candidatus Microthrix sp.]|nr:DUF1206 domain-containing protein [Candidatus Microthrix sp.]
MHDRSKLVVQRRCRTAQRANDAAGDKLDDVADKTNEKLDEHPWAEWLPKAGWLARGFVYAFMGWTVLLISFQKDSADEASSKGAVVALADQSYGRIAIGALAIGLVALVAWQALSLALIRDTDAKSWLKRLSAAGTMIFYGALAFTATRTALGMGADKGGGIERLSKGLLSSTPGRIVVFVGGAIALGVAGYRAYKGWEHKFLKHLDLDGCDPRRRKLIARLGAVGWIGRALVVGLVAGVLDVGGGHRRPRQRRRLRPGPAQGVGHRVGLRSGGSGRVGADRLWAVLRGLAEVPRDPRLTADATFEFLGDGTRLVAVEVDQLHLGPQ